MKRQSRTVGRHHEPFACITAPSMFVDVSCKKCGGRTRLDLGQPDAAQLLEEHLRLVIDRWSHQPSFECFGGHFEFAPPLPRFWEVHWDTLAES